MISGYCQRMIETHIKKLKRVYKIGQYLEVHKFACVYNLKLKPDQLSRGALYCKIMQNVIELSTNPSETYNNFENSHLKSIIFFFVKIKLFTIFQLRLKYCIIKKYSS